MKGRQKGFMKGTITALQAEVLKEIIIFLEEYGEMPTTSYLAANLDRKHDQIVGFMTLLTANGYLNRTVAKTDKYGSPLKYDYELGDKIKDNDCLSRLEQLKQSDWNKGRTPYLKEI